MAHANDISQAQALIALNDSVSASGKELNFKRSVGTTEYPAGRSRNQTDGSERRTILPPHEPKVVLHWHTIDYAKSGSGVQSANFSGNSLPVEGRGKSVPYC